MGDESKQINFKPLFSRYGVLQSAVAAKLVCIQNLTGASPGAFLMLQFQMSQLSQIGDSISNMIGMMNSIASNAIRNIKPS